jgi:predicted DNA binding CopG/RHH family protein
MTRQKLKTNTEQWEDGTLGQSAEHVGVVSVDEELEIDDALGLQLVSVRLQKTLIKDLKELAVKEGLGYQPYLRQILTKYVRNQKQLA